VSDVDPHEVALLRLVAQRLVGPGWPRAADAVRGLCAVQAQDSAGSLCSVALRIPERSQAAVLAAMDAGAIVRSWPMRGTLHLVAAEDLGWMLETLTQRVLRGSVTRRSQLGLDEATLEHGRELASAALDGGRELTRADLFAYWDDHGLSTSGQRGYHLLGYLAQTGTVCFGPVRGREPLVVLVDHWVTEPRRLGRDEALAELAWRYFCGHGPASVKDLMRWAFLTAADARVATDAVRSRLVALDVDGTELLMDPQTPGRLEPVREQARRVLLLPGFDEMVLGYADRSATVPTEYADRIVPGGNGMFRPTVISDGRAVGTWRRTRAGQPVDATAFASFTPAEVEGIAAASAELP
jgi:hypothetical protein